MREKEFRGKRKTGFKDWVTGFLAREDLIFSWCKQSMEEIMLGQKGNTYFYNEYEVDPETVGQYIGHKDKNGKKIFEDDIVKKYYPERSHLKPKIFVATMSSTLPNSEKVYWSPTYFENEKLAYEVIGNIYDNPELLEVKDEKK